MCNCQKMRTLTKEQILNEPGFIGPFKEFLFTMMVRDKHQFVYKNSLNTGWTLTIIPPQGEYQPIGILRTVYDGPIVSMEDVRHLCRILKLAPENPGTLANNGSPETKRWKYFDWFRRMFVNINEIQ